MSASSRRFLVLRSVPIEGPRRRYSIRYQEKDMLGHAITPAPMIVISEGDVELALDSHDIRLLMSMLRDITYDQKGGRK